MYHFTNVIEQTPDNDKTITERAVRKRRLQTKRDDILSKRPRI